MDESGHFEKVVVDYISTNQSVYALGTYDLEDTEGLVSAIE